MMKMCCVYKFKKREINFLFNFSLLITHDCAHHCISKVTVIYISKSKISLLYFTDFGAVAKKKIMTEALNMVKFPPYIFGI